jgi:hypothetical protein
VNVAIARWFNNLPGRRITVVDPEFPEVDDLAMNPFQ